MNAFSPQPAVFSPQPAIYRSYDEDGTKQPANLHPPTTGAGVDPGDPYLSSVGPNSSQLHLEGGTQTTARGGGNFFTKGWKTFASRLGVSRSVEDEAEGASSSVPSPPQHQTHQPRSVISGPSPLHAPPPMISMQTSSPYSVRSTAYTYAPPTPAPPTPTESTDDAFEGTTAVGHHEAPMMYVSQQQQQPPSSYPQKQHHTHLAPPAPAPAMQKPMYAPYAPYTSPDAHTIDPAAAPDYARMSQTSSTGLMSRLKIKLKELNDLPWVAERCTVDYVPPPKQPFRELTSAHRTVPSWYGDSRQRADLLAGESPLPPLPPPEPAPVQMKEAALFGPGIRQVHHDAQEQEQERRRPENYAPETPPSAYNGRAPDSQSQRSYAQSQRSYAPSHRSQRSYSQRAPSAPPMPVPTPGPQQTSTPAMQYPTTPYLSTPAPGMPYPSTSTPATHFSPMPVYGYRVAPPEADDIYSPMPDDGGGYGGRVYTPADGMRGYAVAQTHSHSHSGSVGVAGSGGGGGEFGVIPSASTTTTSTSDSSYDRRHEKADRRHEKSERRRHEEAERRRHEEAERRRQAEKAGAPTMIYSAAGTHSPASTYPYPVPFSPSG